MALIRSQSICSLCKPVSVSVFGFCFFFSQEFVAVQPFKSRHESDLKLSECMQSFSRWLLTQSTASLQVHPRLVCGVSNLLQPCCTLGDRQMVWYSQIADFLLLPSLCLFGYLYSPSTFLLPQSIMGFDWYGFLKSTPVRLKLAPPPPSL